MKINTLKLLKSFTDQIYKSPLFNVSSKIDNLSKKTCKKFFNMQNIVAKNYLQAVKVS